MPISIIGATAMSVSIRHPGCGVVCQGAHELRARAHPAPPVISYRAPTQIRPSADFLLAYIIARIRGWLAASVSVTLQRIARPATCSNSEQANCVQTLLIEIAIQSRYLAGASASVFEARLLRRWEGHGRPDAPPLNAHSLSLVPLSRSTSLRGISHLIS
jgi:hypothetical protein